jgi:hypothetical protein
MRFAHGEEYAFPWSNLEYVITNVYFEFSIKNIHELMFTTVNMRRRLRPASHVREHEIECSPCVVVCCQ